MKSTYLDRPLNEIYDEEFPHITVGDVMRIDKKNANHNYGLSSDELLNMVKRHKTARSKNDYRTMEMIEYQLTDINFHHECGLLSDGEYDKVKYEIEHWDEIE